MNALVCQSPPVPDLSLCWGQRLVATHHDTCCVPDNRGHFCVPKIFSINEETKGWLEIAPVEGNKGASAFLCRSEECFYFLIGTPPASLMNSPCLLPVGICLACPCSRQPCKEMAVFLVGFDWATACRAWWGGWGVMASSARTHVGRCPEGRGPWEPTGGGKNSTRMGLRIESKLYK